MEATRIIPDLQASLLCEEIRQEINGNFILIGVIGLIRVPKVPIRAFKLCLFNRWTAGIGTFTEESRLIAPDGVTQLRKAQVQFQMKDPMSHVINVTVFPNVEFSVPGVYFIEVLVDDIMKIRYPIPLIVQPPTPQGKGESDSQGPESKENTAR